jgi:riboflavin kinase / FMN adenylyltransferase
MLRLTGTVVPGKKQSRLLGAPTANLAHSATESPDPGVWSCTVMHGPATYKAVACVGMWQLDHRLPSCEVHLLDFDGDLYSAELTVVFHKKLRDLQSFDSLEKLKAQIARDIEQARRSFD